MKKKLSVFLLSFGLLSFVSSSAETIGSEAELWKQRSAVAKVAYLEGLCKGLGMVPNSRAADLTCQTPDQVLSGKGKITPRFCSAVSGNDGTVATRFLDQFYQDANHSDVPVWLAVSVYNDKACGESTVGERLVRVQAYAKCARQFANMRDEEKAVIEAKRAACDKLGKELMVPKRDDKK